MADKIEKDQKTTDSSKVNTGTQQVATQQSAAPPPTTQNDQSATQRLVAQEAQSPGQSGQLEQKDMIPAPPNPAQPRTGGDKATQPTGLSGQQDRAPAPPNPAQPRVGGDKVMQNEPAAGQGQQEVKKSKPGRANSTAVYEESLTSGRRAGSGVVTPDDSGYTGDSQRHANLNAASMEVLKNREESAARSRAYQEKQAAQQAKHDAYIQQLLANARTRKEQAAGQRDRWKQGHFEGMTRIDNDTWEALGKRDGGVTSSDVKNDDGTLVQDGTNPDGTPRFKQQYTRNEGSKLDAEKSAGLIKEVNNWWRNEGGFGEYRSKLPTGVFNKKGELDLSKVTTTDQLNAIKSLMDRQRTQMNERRDQAYRNLAQRELRDIYDNPNQPLRGHDRDAQMLVQKGLNTSKYKPDQIAKIAQAYRVNDALKALTGFDTNRTIEADKKRLDRMYGPDENAYNDLKGTERTYFDDFDNSEVGNIRGLRNDEIVDQMNLTDALRNAGLKSTDISNGRGDLDMDSVRKALGSSRQIAAAGLRQATGRSSRADEQARTRTQAKARNKAQGVQPPPDAPAQTGEDFYQQGMEGGDTPPVVEERGTSPDVPAQTGEDFYQQGMEGGDTPPVVEERGTSSVTPRAGEVSPPTLVQRLDRVQSVMNNDTASGDEKIRALQEYYGTAGQASVPDAGTVRSHNARVPRAKPKAKNRRHD